MPIDPSVSWVAWRCEVADRCAHAGVVEVASAAGSSTSRRALLVASSVAFVLLEDEGDVRPGEDEQIQVIRLCVGAGQGSAWRPPTRPSSAARQQPLRTDE